MCYFHIQKRNDDWLGGREADNYNTSRAQSNLIEMINQCKSRYCCYSRICTLLLLLLFSRLSTTGRLFGKGKQRRWWCAPPLINFRNCPVLLWYEFTDTCLHVFVRACIYHPFPIVTPYPLLVSPSHRQCPRAPSPNGRHWLKSVWRAFMYVPIERQMELYNVITPN